MRLSSKKNPKTTNKPNIFLFLFLREFILCMSVLLNIKELSEICVLATCCIFKSFFLSQFASSKNASCPMFFEIELVVLVSSLLPSSV